MIKQDRQAEDDILKKEKTQLTIVMSRYDKLKIKQYALRKGETVSNIVINWIKEFCDE